MPDSKRRLGIFSDIHGNLHALDAVLGCLEDMGVADLICCGDIVGYGAYPNECCERLRQRNIPTIAGNHDHAALLRTNIAFFNDVAKSAVLWTKEALSEENAAYLGNLPMSITEGDFYFVHSSPVRPEQWNYVLTMGEAKESFNHFEQTFCFIGHSHQPFVIEMQDGQIACPSSPEIPIQPGRRYLVNVGSVGQPRDRNPMACFVILDRAAGKIEFHRVPYDIDAAREAILKNGLPPQLADRLAFGA